MSYDHDDRSQESAEGGRSGPSLKLIALVIVVAALAIFFFQNGDDAPVSFLWFDANWPIWLVIGVSVVAGAIIDRLGGWWWRRAKRRKVADQA